MQSQSRMRALIQKYPVLGYFALTFAISWGGILVIVGPSHILASPEVFTSMRWVPALLLGPSVAGILVTALVGGRPGLRAYRSRLLRWRVAARWYAAALLTAPVYYTATALVLSVFSGELLPGIVTSDDKAALLARGIVVGLAGGIFEELGWTGFAVPALRRRCGPVATGLVVGVAWGVWHVLPKLLGASAFDTIRYIPADLLCAVVGLTGFRILMVWVYERTASLLIGILMHVGITASMLVLQPLAVGAAQITVAIALAIAPWVIVAVVGAATHHAVARTGIA